MIAATVVAFPLMYRTALGAFEQVSPNMLDAARTLGASEWRTFRRILLPLAWPGVMAGTVLAFARALGEFGATLMLAGNIPGRTQTMPVAIFFAAEGGDMRGAWRGCCGSRPFRSAPSPAMNYWAQPRRPGRNAPAPPEPLDAARHRAPAVAAATPSHRGGHPARAIRTFELAAKFSNAAARSGLLGASGSGKSMTLRASPAWRRPIPAASRSISRVLFDSATGISVPAADRRIGIVFQDYALFPHMTVRENIAFGLRARSVEEWARLAHVEHVARAISATSCPADSSSAWRWRARWRWSLTRCCSTSRSPRSIRTCGGTWRSSYASC